MVRVLVVDDSLTFRAALAMTLERDPAIKVVGQAPDGEQAIELARALCPDVITLDIGLPGMSGLDAARAIMAARPTPIVVLSARVRVEQETALDALRLGVVDVAEKPLLAGPGGAAGAAWVIQLVKSAASAQLRARPAAAERPLPLPTLQRLPTHVELIAIAASTGGPPALETILRPLPLSGPPVVVAQHLAPSFARSFTSWLAGAIARPVVAVATAERLRHGFVYVATERTHLRVCRGFVEPVPTGSGELAPNADVLFESAAASFGKSGVGVVLTGMGEDGAAGLKVMRAAGGWTIGQDRNSSIVYGMPRIAFEAGACCEVLSLGSIGRRLLGLVAER